ncbi:hypothetical protein JTE90_018354 [Oedothorax gibbosus]|uniref:Uncharacterized protein n=1 Tax=Oedothorax gibbosus TaxID=931172 RepID=A0AAV6TZZ1_9ARAC|nr:hypothetical protein JTE90_018354 [Oedothorax gibbosus]
MMTGSRRFLLLLVLACLTCVVLVQISMDDVTGPRHQYSQEDKGTEETICSEEEEPCSRKLFGNPKSVIGRARAGFFLFGTAE